MPAPTSQVGDTRSATIEIQMQFREAPVGQVLAYLADAGGYSLEGSPPPDLKVTIVAPRPISLRLALNMVNLQLRQSGYMLTQYGTTLKLMPAMASGPI